MSTDLTHHVIAVTGGLGTLGRAIVQACESRGARVVAIDRVAAQTSAPVGAATGSSHVLANVDLSSYEAAEAAMATIVRTQGRLDGLVNVAGGFRWETLGDGDVATWDAMYQVNLRTAVVASKAALPHLLLHGQGRIVNIGAAGAAKAAAGMGAYAASKAGVARFTEALADELKDRGVTVNAILPTTIDTPQNRRDMPDADHSRWVDPRAIAEVVCFLLSNQAQAVTGASIPVAGRT